MKHIPRLYWSQPLATGDIIIIEDKRAHYLLHVLRAKVNDSLKLFHDISGEFDASITQTSRHDVTITISAQTRKPKACPNLIVCVAPIKGNRFDGLIEKATELGASTIQPVITERCVVRKVNLERIHAIATEAAEQSERLDVPAILPEQSFADWLHGWDASTPLIYGDESGASDVLNGTELKQSAKSGWGVLIGPEGGFSDAEFAQLKTQSFAHGVSLGPRILRSETACTSLCTITMQAFGDWHDRPNFRA